MILVKLQITHWTQNYYEWEELKAEIDSMLRAVTIVQYYVWCVSWIKERFRRTTENVLHTFFLLIFLSFLLIFILCVCAALKAFCRSVHNNISIKRTDTLQMIFYANHLRSTSNEHEKRNIVNTEYTEISVYH